MNSRRPQFLEDLKSVLDKSVHDCNNELTGILLNCDMIKAENLEKKIAIVRKRVKKIIGIQHSLSSLSKVDTTQPILAVKIDGNLETLLSDASSELQEKNIAVTLTGKSGVEVNAAPPLLLQMLNYLLRNSIAAVETTEKRNITITTSPGSVSIGNAGPPLEVDIIERMFARDSMKKSHASLALAIAHALIKLQGGRMVYHRVEDQNVFTLQFL